MCVTIVCLVVFVETVLFSIMQGFGSAFFLSDPDPDPDPGKNLHADPDPGGSPGEGAGGKGKNEFFFCSFFHVSDDS